ncbi:Wzz/FepE/Etk N-terminal domain-containing protein [Pseudomonas sp. PDM13]|uniref:Wzz/FepE/Etk N-terminal domain-containing protein n=1 Tax=Pseudomonas sp. PDM13 TaxID=2769255 RepID=UPI0021E09CAD|nr:Wzz/FepE/Etk N-terminal domain-containing protein [Pseudomonas sp. PDM13]MCU9946974.1 Wzz/FepE/Etk N-terminal domain-containing protein [Pseudomonas sp. PDM13]
MNAPLIRPYRSPDEIEFLALLKGLWKQRNLIVVIAFISVALAAIYALVATPQYKVQSVLRPASLKDLDQLNESGVYSLTPEESLGRVIGSLGSYSLRLAFLEANPELVQSIRKADEPLGQLLDRLNHEGFSLVASEARKPGEPVTYQGISFTYPEGVDGVAITNGLVSAAVDQERKRLQEDMEVLVNNRLSMLQAKVSTEKARYDAGKSARIAELLEGDQLAKASFQDELKALRQQLLAARQNRIKTLDEAILIAEKLGIVKPTTPSVMAESGKAGQGNFIRTEVNNKETPLYFMGTDALMAERAALRSRVSDDFVEPRVAELQAKLSLLEHNRQVEVLKKRGDEEVYFKDIVKLSGERAKLESLKVEFALLDFSKLRLVHIDQLASPPQEPVKPQRFLILLGGLVLGLILGAGVATVRVMILHASTSIRQEVTA